MPSPSYVVDENIVPYLIRMKVSLSSSWKIHLGPELVELYDSLVNVLGNDNKSVCYAVLLKHYIKTIRKNPDFNPNKYKKLFFSDALNYNEPLFFYDPYKTINTLIESFQTIKDFNKQEYIAKFDNFRFNIKGILQGREKNEKFYTPIIAYCGGYIDKKGPCGFSPLIIGKHKLCQRCNKLICPKCDFCSNNCSRYIKRKEFIKYFQEMKNQLKLENPGKSDKEINRLISQEKIKTNKGIIISLEELNDTYIKKQLFDK